MKRLTLVVLAVCMACGFAFAQQGEKAVGINLGYGSGDFHKAFKIGAEFKYNVTDAIRIAPGFDYFFKSNGVGLWGINANAHYLFDIKSVNGLKVYPLAGISLLGSLISDEATGIEGVDWDDIHPGIGDYVDGAMEEATKNQTKFGFNIGAGIQYPVMENIDLGFEIKYQFVSDFDQIVFGISAAYKF